MIQNIMHRHSSSCYLLLHRPSRRHCLRFRHIYNAFNVHSGEVGAFVPFFGKVSAAAEKQQALLAEFGKRQALSDLFTLGWTYYLILIRSK
jgi:hypothetical protein